MYGALVLYCCGGKKQFVIISLALLFKSCLDHFIVPLFFLMSKVTSVPDTIDLVHIPKLYTAGPLGAPRGLSYSGRQVRGLVSFPTAVQ